MDRNKSLKNNIFNKAGDNFDGYQEGQAGNEDKILRNFFSGNNGLMVIVLRYLMRKRLAIVKRLLMKKLMHIILQPHPLM